MKDAILEHVNITVSNPDKSAELLGNLFDWQVRWRGQSKLGGYTVHVGAETDYIALYTHPKSKSPKQEYETGYLHGGLNHVGVLVADLDETEQRVISAGLTPHSHDDYTPGRRFYFDDPDGVEFEVISY